MSPPGGAAVLDALDVHWMQQALALARQGQYSTRPNPAVGCVIVKDGLVLGRGWTQPGGRPHAETEALAALAARLTGTPLVVSHATAETDAAFAARLPELARSADFLRTLAPPPAAVLRAAHEAGLNWIDAPFSPDGRSELTRWLREQSVTETRHRYGNVLDRRR